MLFDKRQRTINRLLIVEDEPLVAFDNEHALTEAGYVVAATVDSVAEALRIMESEALDLLLLDFALSDGGSGADVAIAAKKLGIPVLFVTGHCSDTPKDLALGCLSKPYRPRDLLAAISILEAMLSGNPRKRLPPGLKLYSNESD